MNLLAERGPPLPSGATCYRSIGPFALGEIPAGLLREHRLKPGAWGMLSIELGLIRFVWDDAAGGSQMLRGGERLLVPSQVPHHLEPCGPERLRIEFWGVPG